jgi:hypothetical protein
MVKPVLTTRTPISSTVDKEIWQQFQELSKQTRIPASKLLDEAIGDLIRKYQTKG